ncbi:MAG: maleylpyruvate isomerase N-terminal domain-containing protein [Nocardioidaceae bacterium]
MTPGSADYLTACASVLELLGRVEVVDRWSAPSALAEMSVGALAAHLASQVLSVHAAVTAGTGATDDEPVTLLEHYARVPWASEGLDDESNVAIRDGAERSAGVGHDVLVAATATALEDLGLAFGASLPVGLPPAIRMPWWQWSLSFEDFLVTRVMEIAVHSDDLAVSVNVEPPQLSEQVLGPVLALLVGVSLRRHGQSAVLRALSRSERAPASVSAF